MAGKPICYSYERSCEIGEHGLRTHPSAPDTAEEHGEQHNTDEEQEQNKQEEIRFTNPENGTEKVEPEGRDIESEGALVADPQKWKPEYDCGRQPCCQPAAGFKSIQVHHVLVFVVCMDKGSQREYFCGSKLRFERRHTFCCSLTDDADVVFQ
jgi:hypothetical protein